MRSRLHVALALALVLALATASGSLLGSSKQFLGKTSSSASATLPDDAHGDAVGVVPQPLLVVALLFALSLVARTLAAPSGASASDLRRARAPPSR